MRGPSVAAAIAFIALFALPSIAAAHPLGNFTINHYAGIRVTPESILVDVVIDHAEIPTVAEYGRLDADGDGELTDAEIEAGRINACGSLARDLALTVDGASASLAAHAAGLSFAPGLGGLPTMRTVCEYESPLARPVAMPIAIAFADRSDESRLGWREMTVIGDRMSIVRAPVGPESASARLTAYPQDLLSTPLHISAVEVSAVRGGPAASPFLAPDAQPLVASNPPVPDRSPSIPVVRAAPAPGVIPGGIPDELSSVLADPRLGLVTMVTTIGLALALGAVHALSPGHGKTVMAAYLVGTRGTARQALGLGLTITISHTTGVLVLAIIVLSATSIIPPDRAMPALALVSGIGFIAVGAWMLVGQWATWRRRRRATNGSHHHEHRAEPHHEHRDNREGVNDQTLAWRGLIGLGLIGGLVPSVSALILLLGSLAAGRAAYGVVLVVAFGVGMAITLAGIGLALVLGRGYLEERIALGQRTAAMFNALPVLAAAVVVAAGVYVTAGAVNIRL